MHMNEISGLSKLWVPGNGYKHQVDTEKKYFFIYANLL